jgi:release factor glutamine methyltransferase
VSEAHRGGAGVALSIWLREAAARLSSVSDTPRLDAELLAGHALDMDRSELLLALPWLTAPVEAEVLLERRLAHEPMAYIIGTRDFWTLTLQVKPGVLVPRPDSETLIEAAIDYFNSGAPQRILDLGTGTGALLLAALDHWPKATGLGIDASKIAVDLARENAVSTGIGERTEFRLGDWLNGVDDRFDLILCNPPYIAQDADLPADVRDYEPASALFAGQDGLDDYRLLAGQIGPCLAPGGVAIFEIGYDQGDTAAALFREAGFAVSLRRDLAGQARTLIVTASA